MAVTVTKIVNLGLSALGEARISSITASDPVAVKANEIWESVRDAVLADPEAEWSVAIARSELAELDVTNLTPFDYIYQLPIDPWCLRVVNLIDPSNDYGDVRPQDAEYRIEGRTLLVDESPCAIKYVKRVEDVTEFDPLLVQAMAYAMAAHLAFTITQSRENEARMWQLYAGKVLEAKGADASNRWQGYRTLTSLADVAIGTHPIRRRYYE